MDRYAKLSNPISNGSINRNILEFGDSLRQEYEKEEQSEDYYVLEKIRELQREGTR